MVVVAVDERRRIERYRSNVDFPFPPVLLISYLTVLNGLRVCADSRHIQALQ